MSGNTKEEHMEGIPRTLVAFAGIATVIVSVANLSGAPSVVFAGIGGATILFALLGDD